MQYFISKTHADGNPKLVAPFRLVLHPHVSAVGVFNVLDHGVDFTYPVLEL